MRSYPHMVRLKHQDERVDYMNRLLSWILSSDTGSSSWGIFFCMTGLHYKNDYRDSGAGEIQHCFSWPSDSHDFGRCYRLLQRFPEWRKTLPLCTEFLPSFTWVNKWDELEKFYLEKCMKNGQVIYQSLDKILRKQS